MVRFVLGLINVKQKQRNLALQRSCVTIFVQNACTARLPLLEFVARRTVSSLFSGRGVCARRGRSRHETCYNVGHGVKFLRRRCFPLVCRGEGMSSMPRHEEGFSLIELLIVVAIILIIAAIAIPNLIRSRIAANQASAIESLRVLGTAEVTYAAIYGNGYSATSPNWAHLPPGPFPAPPPPA